MIAPVYIVEILPSIVKGSLTSFAEIFVNMGILLGCISNYLKLSIFRVAIRRMLIAGCGIPMLPTDHRIGWAILFVFANVAFFSVGIGPVCWVLSSEIFPLRLRAQASDLGAVGSSVTRTQQHCAPYPCRCDSTWIWVRNTSPYGIE
ncbi:hypothetical protein REPUB_Repub14bG0129000 [Reevesia pubescens]